jgi:hypothetical protein
MIDESPGDMSGESATPATNQLFEVNHDNPIALDKKIYSIIDHSKTIVSL